MTVLSQVFCFSTFLHADWSSPVYFLFERLLNPVKEPSAFVSFKWRIMTDLVQNITVRQNRKVTAMPEAPKEPTLRDLYILLQAVDQRLTVIENDLNQRVVAVESSLEFACAKISSMEAEVSDLKKQLSESHRQVEKYRIQDEFRSIVDLTFRITTCRSLLAIAFRT